MHKVYVWVPTKGWKAVCESSDKVVVAKAFSDFQPLEVKLVTSDGQTFHAGHCHECVEPVDLIEKRAPPL